MEHQRREEEEAQDKANRQPVIFNALPVQPFTAVNEDNLQEDPPATPVNTDNDSEKFTVSETDESIEVFPDITGNEEAETPNTESEEENLREEDLDNELVLEPEYQSSDEDIQVRTPSPDREITFTPPSTKNARRQAIKRKRKRLQRTQDQYEEQKKKTTLKRRLYGAKKSPFLRIDPPRTTPPRDKPKPKRRRESRESIEEVDPQGRKLPKNKKKSRRH